MRGLTICGLIIACFFQLNAQGIEFFEGSWQEALEKAKSEGKIIFVDAFATWCGPCKRMAKTVFPDEAVGKFYNKHFVNLKLDMERGEGLKFRQKYPVSAFPTLYYIDANGEVVSKVRGAQQVESFINIGKEALSKVDYSKAYAEEYEGGNRDPELIYKYVRALNRSGKPSLKVANDYLQSQSDLTTAHNLKFILEATTVADSKIFDLLIEYRSKIEAVTSEEAVRERILNACEGTVERAIEYRSEALLEEAKEKMKKHYPEAANSFALQEDMHFCLALNESEDYLDACKKYAKKEAKGDPEELLDLAKTISKHYSAQSAAMEQAEEFAKDAAKRGNQYNYYFFYAQILNQNGKKEEAREAAFQSLKLAEKEKPRTKKLIEDLIDRIETS